MKVHQAVTRHCLSSSLYLVVEPGRDILWYVLLGSVACENLSIGIQGQKQSGFPSGGGRDANKKKQDVSYERRYLNCSL